MVGPKDIPHPPMVGLFASQPQTPLKGYYRFLKHRRCNLPPVGGKALLRLHDAQKIEHEHR
jgi:hypothetical protein